MSLVVTPNIPDPDGFYTDLLAAHDGLSKAQGDALNARLILVLANHVGDREILREALRCAANGAEGQAGPGPARTGVDSA